MQQKIEIGTVNDNGKQPVEQKVVSSLGQRKKTNNETIWNE